MATFNVKDYGALGNGVANDRAAIQAALDAAYAAGGGVVYIPKGTYAIDGGSATATYAGLQVRDNITVMGDGIGQTIIKAKDGSSSGFTGLIRTPVDEETNNVTIKDLTLDGNRANTTGKVDGFFCGTEPGSPEQCHDITLLRVEAKDCSGYGIDPHEQTVRMWIESCISHGNGLDGFTLDFLIDSTIKNNVAYDNDRHGFNIVTQTRDTLLEGNIAHDNGSAGIIVQRGSENVPSPHGITIRGGEVYGNVDGIQLKMSDDIDIDGVWIHNNDREGIKIYGSSHVTVTNSKIENNSMLGSDKYAEIYVNQYVDSLTSSTFFPTGNVITNNIIRSDETIHASYGVRESVETTDSLISGNTFEGTFIRAQTLTGPQVRVDMPDLKAPTQDFFFQIPQNAYVDIDSGDSVSLSLQLVNSSGQLVNGGALPSWLTFNSLQKTIVGDDPAAGTYYLQVKATDKSGNAEVDLFKLTVSSSGSYNVQIGGAPPPPPPGTFNVKDYGAFGDGVHNDRDAIQAAVDAAAQAGGGIVYMPTGVYGIGDEGLGKTYAGIQLSDGVTLRGAGMGSTVIKVLDNQNIDITGVVRTLFNTPNNHVTMEDFSIDGNRSHNSSGKVDGVFVGTAPGSTQQDSDIIIRRVEVMNNSGYGFDPHEQTIRLTMENNVAHHNGLDGFALDYLIDSTIRNNTAYSNDRHGFNVVTTTHDTLLEGNNAYNNGGNGITVQRGSENIPSPYDVIIRGGDIHHNALAGVLIKYSDDITIENINSHDNGREGVKIDGSDDVIVRNSTISNNSQVGADLYSEIYVAHSLDTVTNTTFVSERHTITGNTITTNGATKASWLIRETPQVSDGFVGNNTFVGSGIDGVSRTGPQIRTETPDLVAPNSAFNYVIPASAIVDTDPGDAITVKLELVNSSGALVNGGALPSWLSFNAANWTLNGNPTSTQTIYLRVSAQDASGDVEYDTFKLTVASSGPYNVNPGNVAGPPPPPPPPGTGTAGNDTMTGTSGDDSLSGLGGNDSIFGGAGADTMTGGDGNDVFNVDDAGDKVVEVTNLGLGGVDRVESTVSVMGLWSEVENLTLLGTADLAGVGNGNANRIVGNSGNNTLDGGLGNDTLVGGAGNDTYFINVTGDSVQESAGGGTDTVYAGFSYTLAAELENLNLIGTAANGTGNGLNNWIIGNGLDNKLTGNGGNDTLDGGAGNDTLRGNAGDDIYVVDAAGDNVAEDAGQGYDTVLSSVTFSIGSNVEKLVLVGSGAINGTGNSGNNVLEGNSGANQLSGTGGNDTLVGYGGADTLTGGSNADRFVFTSAADSSEAASDKITDFKKADVDVLDLSLVDANVNAAGDQAFVWATSFTGVAGQAVLSYNSGTNLTTLRMDTDGDGAGDDMVILLTGKVDQTFGFVL